MIEVPILAENEQVKTAVLSFIGMYREIFIEYLNQTLYHDGQPVDAGISLNEDGSIDVYQLAPDKGLVVVWTKEDEKVPVQFAQYADVPEDTVYVVQERDSSSTFLKTPDGEPDLKLGVFKRFPDVVIAAKDPIVKEQIAERIKAVKAEKAAKQKKIDKAERKATEFRELVEVQKEKLNQD